MLHLEMLHLEMLLFGMSHHGMSRLTILYIIIWNLSGIYFLQRWPGLLQCIMAPGEISALDVLLRAGYRQRDII
jgi:hypothetical protein